MLESAIDKLIQKVMEDLPKEDLMKVAKRLLDLNDTQGIFDAMRELNDTNEQLKQMGRLRECFAELLT